MLKKIFPIFISLILISPSINAQFEKNQLVLESDLNYSVIESDYEEIENKTTQQIFSINPSLNLFLTENLLLGIGIQYMTVKREFLVIFSSGNSSIIQTKNSTFLLTPSLRLYHPITKGITYYTQLSPNIGFSSFEEEDDVSDEKPLAIDFKLKHGVQANISNTIAFRVSINSLYYTRQRTYQNIGNSFTRTIYGLNTTFSTLEVGISISL